MGIVIGAPTSPSGQRCLRGLDLQSVAAPERRLEVAGSVSSSGSSLPNSRSVRRVAAAPPRPRWAESCPFFGFATFPPAPSPLLECPGPVRRRSSKAAPQPSTISCSAWELFLEDACSYSTSDLRFRDLHADAVRRALSRMVSATLCRLYPLRMRIRIRRRSPSRSSTRRGTATLRLRFEHWIDAARSAAHRREDAIVASYRASDPAPAMSLRRRRNRFLRASSCAGASVSSTSWSSAPRTATCDWQSPSRVRADASREYLRATAACVRNRSSKGSAPPH